MKTMFEIEPFQETLSEGMCGPASLKIVLGYYGVEKSETELAELCGHDRKLGTDAAGIRRAAESLGFEVEIKNGSSFEDMEAWLAKDVPVIVDWFTRGRQDYPESEVADGHYSVVAGLDEESIHLQDPEIGRMRRIKREDFLRVWFDFEGELIGSDNLVIRQMIAIFK